MQPAKGHISTPFSPFTTESSYARYSQVRIWNVLHRENEINCGWNKSPWRVGYWGKRYIFKNELYASNYIYIWNPLTETMTYRTKMWGRSNVDEMDIYSKYSGAVSPLFSLSLSLYILHGWKKQWIGGWENCRGRVGDKRACHFIAINCLPQFVLRGKPVTENVVHQRFNGSMRRMIKPFEKKSKSTENSRNNTLLGGKKWKNISSALTKKPGKEYANENKLCNEENGIGSKMEEISKP